MAQGTNPEHTRAYNRRAVLQALRLGGSLSRTEIARATSLSLQAVSNIIETLVAEGLVSQGPRRSTNRGQPPLDFSLNPDGAYAFGFSVDQEKVSGVLLNLVGELLAEEHRQVAHPGIEEALGHMEDLRSRLLDGVRIDPARLRGLGLSLPGVIEEDGGNVARMVRLPEWEGNRIAELVQERLGLPAFAGNDATLAAIGEMWHGAGKTIPTFFYVLFALGLGSSLILDGAPHRSIWSVSGRLGHIPVEPDGWVCPSCGERGCLSLYTSLGALYEYLGQKGVAAESPADLERLHANGDLHLASWLDQASHYFVRAFVVLENLIDPDGFVFGGDLPAAVLDELLRKIRERYDQRRVRLRRQPQRFLASRFEARAAAVGAATLPIYLETAARYDLVLVS